MSPWMGVAPHSTVATTTGSGKTAECMAAGGQMLWRLRPRSRSRSRVLRPSGSQGSSHPQVPPLSYMGASGKELQLGKIHNPFDGAKRKTLNVPFTGVERKRRKGTEANTSDKNFWKGGGAQGGGTSGQVGSLPSPWKRVSGKESQASSSIGRSYEGLPVLVYKPLWLPSLSYQVSRERLHFSNSSPLTTRC